MKGVGGGDHEESLPRSANPAALTSETHSHESIDTLIAGHRPVRSSGSKEARGSGKECREATKRAQPRLRSARSAENQMEERKDEVRLKDKC